VDDWRKFPDEKPEDRQNVAFVVKSTRDTHLNGLVLGGFYSAASETFSVPGCGFDATHWRPMFEAP